MLAGYHYIHFYAEDPGVFTYVQHIIDSLDSMTGPLDWSGLSIAQAYICCSPTSLAGQKHPSVLLLNAIHRLQVLNNEESRQGRTTVRTIIIWIHPLFTWDESTWDHVIREAAKANVNLQFAIFSWMSLPIEIGKCRRASLREIFPARPDSPPNSDFVQFYNVIYQIQYKATVIRREALLAELQRLEILMRATGRHSAENSTQNAPPHTGNDHLITDYGQPNNAHMGHSSGIDSQLSTHTNHLQPADLQAQSQELTFGLQQPGPSQIAANPYQFDPHVFNHEYNLLATNHPQETNYHYLEATSPHDPSRDYPQASLARSSLALALVPHTTQPIQQDSIATLNTTLTQDNSHQVVPEPERVTGKRRRKNEDEDSTDAVTTAQPLKRLKEYADGNIDPAWNITTQSDAAAQGDHQFGIATSTLDLPGFSLDNLETPAVPDLPSDDFVLTPLVNAQAVMSEKARGKQKEASSYESTSDGNFGYLYPSAEQVLQPQHYTNVGPGAIASHAAEADIGGINISNFARERSILNCAPSSFTPDPTLSLSIAASSRYSPGALVQPVSNSGPQHDDRGVIDLTGSSPIEPIAKSNTVGFPSVTPSYESTLNHHSHHAAATQSYPTAPLGRYRLTPQIDYPPMIGGPPLDTFDNTTKPTPPIGSSGRRSRMRKTPNGSQAPTPSGTPDIPAAPKRRGRPPKAMKVSEDPPVSCEASVTTPQPVKRNARKLKAASGELRRSDKGKGKGKGKNIESVDPITSVSQPTTVGGAGRKPPVIQGPTVAIDPLGDILSRRGGDDDSDLALPGSSHKQSTYALNHKGPSLSPGSLLEKPVCKIPPPNQNEHADVIDYSNSLFTPTELSFPPVSVPSMNPAAESSTADCYSLMPMQERRQTSDDTNPWPSPSHLDDSRLTVADYYAELFGSVLS